ncbi:serine/threonine-protein kinase [Kitasatospora herbaricolor]|uniref:serine/threonine-protein kinase n=1 Tax=Kitasatospora herbaricolor TaxID=68217 RepID=UPI0036D8912F
MTQAQGSTGRLLAGRYRLDAVLGRGGMGTVWRAEDEMLGRVVAVKELRMHGGVDEEEKHRLIVRTLREAKATARIRHTAAVTVFDVVEEDDRPWIVMELVESRSLAEVIKEDGPLTPVRAAEIALDVLGVLVAAHSHGILHRDVKPSNVLIGEDGRVVLTDFGIASVEGDASVTSTGMLVGAPSYISPERARGQKPGPPADLWSLGGTLYAMLEGRPPYDRGSALATLTAVMTEDLAAPANAGPLKPVIEGLLEKDPARRLDASQTRAMLRRVVAQATVKSEATTQQAVPVAGADRAAAAAAPAAAAPAAAAPVEEPGAPAGPAAPASGAKRPVGGLLGTVRVGSRSKAPAQAPAEPERPAATPAAAGAAAAVGAGAPATAPGAGQWSAGETVSARPGARLVRAVGGRRRAVILAVVLALVLIAGVVLARTLGGSEQNGAGKGGGQNGAAATAGGANPPAPAGDTASGEPAGGPTAAQSPAPGASSQDAGPGPAQTTPAGEPQASRSASPAAATTPPAAPAGPAVPAGYHEHKDAAGFSIVLPDWLADAGEDYDRTSRKFEGQGVKLVVDWTQPGGASALADWQSAESGQRGGYQRVALQAITYRQWTNAADWEWTFNSSGGTRMHSLNRGFVTGGGKYGYALYWTTTDAAWAAPGNVQARQTGFDSFQPAP